MLEHLGLTNIDESLVEVSVSIVGEHKRSQSHPRGSTNKPKEELLVCPSSPTSFVFAHSDGAQFLPPERVEIGPIA